MNQHANEQILSAASALLHDGQTEAIGRHIAPDYVVYTADRDPRGGPSLIRSVIELKTWGQVLNP